MKTLISSGNKIADPKNQIQILENKTSNECRHETFENKLKSIGLYPLKSAQLEILQVNVGKMCNQTCTHCHVDAGPDRKEIMTKEMITEGIMMILYKEIPLKVEKYLSAYLESKHKKIDSE